MQLTDFLTEQGDTYKRRGESPHVTGDNIGVQCPYCGEGTGKYGMGLFPGSFNASCWKCGKHRLVTVLAEITGEHPRVIAALLGTFERGPQHTETKGRLILPKGIGPLLPCHKDYLESRGFNVDELAGLWGVRGIGLTARLAWRLFIPIVCRGKTVSWTTRGITDEGRRYINARPEEEALRAKSLLYGEDYCTHAVVIVEGPTDAWRIGPGAVATFGLSFTTAQVRRLSRYPLRVICFDNEAGAQQQAAKLCRELSTFPGRTLRVELDAPDPGSASAREIRILRRLYID